MLLLPAGTVLNREIIEKVRSMDAEFEALLCLGRGEAPKIRSPGDLLAQHSRQRTVGERIAEAFGSMRDISFVLFCVSAILAFSFGSGRFAIFAGAMLAAMLLNAWLSLHFLHRLSILDRIFAGLSRARAS